MMDFFLFFTEKMCAAPNIANAKIVGEQRPKYNINSRIQYKCNPGFEPEQPVQITCNPQTEWTGILQCTGMLVTYDTDMRTFSSDSACQMENGTSHSLNVSG